MNTTTTKKNITAKKTSKQALAPAEQELESLANRIMSAAPPAAALSSVTAAAASPEQVSVLTIDCLFDGQA